jgi:hypothetical protein
MCRLNTIFSNCGITKNTKSLKINTESLGGTHCVNAGFVSARTA